MYMTVYGTDIIHVHVIADPCTYIIGDRVANDSLWHVHGICTTEAIEIKGTASVING